MLYIFIGEFKGRFRKNTRTTLTDPVKIIHKANVIDIYFTIGKNQ